MVEEISAVIRRWLLGVDQGSTTLLYRVFITFPLLRSEIEIENMFCPQCAQLHKDVVGWEQKHKHTKEAQNRV